jgi:dihydroorotate dehydrogenase
LAIQASHLEFGQRRLKKLEKKIGDGQVFGVSVYGTSSENTTLKQLAQDYAKTALLAKESEAMFIEANLACPNVSGAEDPFLYKDAKAVAEITRAIKSKIGNLPLILKIGYFEKYENLLSVLKKSKDSFEGISAINTISKKIVNNTGKQALQGRDVSGVCGFAIKEYGISTVRNLKKAKKELKSNFEIIGVGGVMSPSDVLDYLNAGADHVHSATAVMWNPYLAHEFNQKYSK